MKEERPRVHERQHKAIQQHEIKDAGHFQDSC